MKGMKKKVRYMEDVTFGLISAANGLVRNLMRHDRCKLRCQFLVQCIVGPGAGTWLFMPPCLFV